LPGGRTDSVAWAVSSDGTTVVGAGDLDGPRFCCGQAFRWTDEGGMQALGDLPGGYLSSKAEAVSADGSIIVGIGSVSVFEHRAFIWDQSHGLRELQHVLATDYGLELDGWTLTSAQDISADGRTIVGYGENPLGRREAWIVVLVPEPAGISLAIAGIALAYALLSIRRRATQSL
jgi:uncharacterized membrane protein